MTILYNILRNFLVYFVPIVIIIFSVSLGLPNASLHKQTFKNTDFYNKLSKEIKKLKENEKINTDSKDPKTLAQNSAFSLFGGSISELATADWLENVITKNVDLTSDWLLEKQSEWTFYFPSGQVQTSLNQNLDKQTKDLVNTKKSDIPECSSENLEKLKGGNFDLAKNFCLPKEVKEGTNNLSDFLPKVDINSLTNGLNLNANIDNFKAQNLGIASSKSYEFFVGMRQYLTKIRTGSPYVLSGFFAVLLIITILAGVIGRGVRKDLVSNLWKISLSTLSLCVVFMLVLGGLFMLNSWATNWILPGANVPGLSDLLTWQWIWFLFDLVSVAFWASFGMILLNLILIILPKGSTEKLNKHLQEKPQQRPDFNHNSNYSKQNTNSNLDNDPDPDNLDSINRSNNSYNSSQVQPKSRQQNNNTEENSQNQNTRGDLSQDYQNKQSSSNSNYLTNQSNQPFSNFDQQFQQEMRQNSAQIPKITPQISDIIRQEKSQDMYQTPTQIPRTRSIPPQNVPQNEHNLSKSENLNTFTNENIPKNYPNLEIPQTKFNSEMQNEVQNPYAQDNLIEKTQNLERSSVEINKTRVNENSLDNLDSKQKPSLNNYNNSPKNDNSFILVDEIDRDYDFETDDSNLHKKSDTTQR